jgi:hypothetical protein
MSKRLNYIWHGFTLDTDPDQARALFEKRHGYPPAEVVKSGCVLLVGPIGENGQEAREPTQGYPITVFAEKRSWANLEG